MATTKTYKEELTERMHSEFSVSDDTDRKHRTFSAITSMHNLDYSIEQVSQLYNVTEDDINTHRAEYDLLFV